MKAWVLHTARRGVPVPTTVTLEAPGLSAALEKSRPELFEYVHRSTPTPSLFRKNRTVVQNIKISKYRSGVWYLMSRNVDTTSYEYSVLAVHHRASLHHPAQDRVKNRSAILNHKNAAGNPVRAQHLHGREDRWRVFCDGWRLEHWSMNTPSLL